MDGGAKPLSFLLVACDTDVTARLDSSGPRAFAASRFELS
jgi:hypothetical protein